MKLEEIRNSEIEKELCITHQSNVTNKRQHNTITRVKYESGTFKALYDFLMV